MFPLEVSQALALELGLTDEQYSIWTEMELITFSVLLYCRKYVRSVQPLRSFANGWDRCQRTMFVARDEHEEAKIIACPLPDCNHAWCKQCQQSIDFNGPKHSCDGTSELDHLMKEQGWKYCPSEPVPATLHLLGAQFSCLFFSMQDTHPENIGMQSHVGTSLQFRLC